MAGRVLRARNMRSRDAACPRRRLRAARLPWYGSATRRTRLLVMAASLLLLTGHGDGDGGGCGCGCGGSDAAPTPTGATCPAGSQLTYATFAAEFMESYCTRCNSSGKVGDDRRGAPDDHDFDTLAGIVAVGDHIADYAGAGPAATNTIMQPEAPRPRRGTTAPRRVGSVRDARVAGRLARPGRAMTHSIARQRPLASRLRAASFAGGGLGALVTAHRVRPPPSGPQIQRAVLGGRRRVAQSLRAPVECAGGARWRANRRTAVPTEPGVASP